MNHPENPGQNINASQELNLKIAEAFARQPAQGKDLPAFIAESFARALEAHGETLGWDAGACLVELILDGLDDDEIDTLEKIMTECGTPIAATTQPAADEEEFGVAERFGYAVTGRVIPLTGEHILEDITGRHASDDCIGVGYAFEAWAYSPEAEAKAAAGEKMAYTPAEDPHRVELRQAIVILKDGTLATVVRVRGQEPQVVVSAPGHHNGLEWGGRIMDGLRRYLRLPTGTPERSIREVAAAAYLMLAVEETIAGAWKRQNRPRLGEQLTSVVGFEKALILCGSREHETWSAARDWAADIIRNTADQHLPKNGRDGLVARWAREQLEELEWLDDAMLARQYNAVPTLRQAAEIVARLTRGQIISRYQAKNLLARARRVKEEGWPAGEGIGGN